ncbi:hypothetical protein VitviT2T_029622 [Vitis vinifera]|uniref:Uncharacterized protein n=1 Tax=Vitis vinifera TaxID=29760 RepID=A0ABY9DYP2_VITVI|nr:hypothetical protein VitviT2T_029622 [Vitis vinifera]
MHKLLFFERLKHIFRLLLCPCWVEFSFESSLFSSWYYLYLFLIHGGLLCKCHKFVD